MIKPTVGRIVWVRRNESLDTTQPEAAQIVFVNGDNSINVVGHDKMGGHFFIFDLHLEHDAERAKTLPWPIAEWMPFQKGQAAKTEELERQVGHGG
jgi:hypothetical protein